MQVVWGNVEAVVMGAGGGDSRICVTTRAPRVRETIEAQVGLKTVIARGTQRIPLNDIKAGEYVELSYTETGDCLEAWMVYVRSTGSFYETPESRSPALL